MGSATYEWMVRNAEQVAKETGSPWLYNQPAWIFSSRKLPMIDGANIHFANGDVHQVHREMRVAAKDKIIWIIILLSLVYSGPEYQTLRLFVDMSNTIAFLVQLFKCKQTYVLVSLENL